MKPLFKQYLKSIAEPSVVSPEEVEAMLGTPIVGIVPHLERRKNLRQTARSIIRRVNPDGRWRSRLLTNFPSPSSIHETYGVILKQMVDPAGDTKKVFMICSATATEGTTTTTANIGIAAALSGIPTVIVEAHNRASRLSRAFNLKLEPGLSAIVEQHEPVHKVLQATEIPDLSLITAGRPVHYAAKMWESPHFSTMLQELRETFRLVLLEAAPVSDYPDVVALAQKSDSVVFIHHFGKASLDSFKKSLERIKDEQKSILGVVINDAG